MILAEKYCNNIKTVELYFQKEQYPDLLRHEMKHVQSCNVHSSSDTRWDYAG